MAENVNGEPEGLAAASVKPEPEVLVVADTAAWRAWLDAHEDESDGVWLLLAKKGKQAPTTIDYQGALLEALCSGWIDGQSKGIDDATFRQRFTPRRRTSIWSKRNIGLVAELIEQGRMRPRGQAEIDRAKADGRWDRAYDGSASAELPEDFARALAASPSATAMYATLGSQGRYACYHRVFTAPSAASRANRIAKLIATLERGETP